VATKIRRAISGTSTSTVAMACAPSMCSISSSSSCAAAATCPQRMHHIGEVAEPRLSAFTQTYRRAVRARGLRRLRELCDSFWSNVLPLTIPKAPAKVYAPDCVGKPHYEPRTIIVACGDGTGRLPTGLLPGPLPRACRGADHTRPCRFVPVEGVRAVHANARHAAVLAAAPLPGVARRHPPEGGDDRTRPLVQRALHDHAPKFDFERAADDFFVRWRVREALLDNYVGPGDPTQAW
jgi:hypothetical protein